MRQCIWPSSLIRYMRERLDCQICLHVADQWQKACWVSLMPIKIFFLSYNTFSVVWVVHTSVDHSASVYCLITQLLSVSRKATNVVTLKTSVSHRTEHILLGGSTYETNVHDKAYWCRDREVRLDRLPSMHNIENWHNILKNNCQVFMISWQTVDGNSLNRN